MLFEISDTMYINSPVSSDQHTCGIAREAEKRKTEREEEQESTSDS